MNLLEDEKGNPVLNAKGQKTWIMTGFWDNLVYTVGVLTIWILTLQLIGDFFYRYR